LWEKSFISTSRGKFECFIQGEGEPICISHLYSEFNDLGYYFADSFINDFKVYLINLRAAGNSCSAEKEEQLSMNESIEDLEAIRKALGIEFWSFAGHSTGGMLGLVYASIYPQSLSRLMVGGAAASKRFTEHEGSMYCPNSPLNTRLREIFSVFKSKDASVEEKRQASREWTNMSIYHLEKRDEYFQKPSSGRVVQERLDYFSFHDLPTFDILHKLTQVRIPSIVYCGRHDAQCPLVFSKEISAALPNSTLYIYEDSNHIPYLEEKEKFIEMVSDFKGL
jgi:proline iminopeptidase